MAAIMAAPGWNAPISMPILNHPHVADAQQRRRRGRIDHAVITIAAAHGSSRGLFPWLNCPFV
jgi:hypothetical protein